jgi:hypothetical protein
MGTPTPESRNAALFDWVGLCIQGNVRDSFATTATILDVGAGWGKYHFLLPEYTMDACEIWALNVEKNQLCDLYREVFTKDICDLKFNYYDVLIFGDVLEHIPRTRAKELLLDVWERCGQLYIAVPFLYEQGPHAGNPYEKHEQDDLTLELMEKEYPMLHLLERDDKRGVYTK